MTKHVPGAKPLSLLAYRLTNGAAPSPSGQSVVSASGVERYLRHAPAVACSRWSFLCLLCALELVASAGCGRLGFDSVALPDGLENDAGTDAGAAADPDALDAGNANFDSGTSAGPAEDAGGIDAGSDAQVADAGPADVALTPGPMRR